MNELLQATVESTEFIMELSEKDNTIQGALSALEELHTLYELFDTEMSEVSKDLFREDFKIIGLDVDNYSKESFLSSIGKGLKAAWEFIWRMLKVIWKGVTTSYNWFKSWFVKEDSPTGGGGGELHDKIEKATKLAAENEKEDPMVKLEEIFSKTQSKTKILNYKDALEMRSDLLQIQNTCDMFSAKLKPVDNLVVYFSNPSWFDNDFRPVVNILKKYGFKYDLINTSMVAKTKLPVKSRKTYSKLGWTMQNTLDLRGNTKDVNSISKSTLNFYKEMDELVKKLSDAKKGVDPNKLPLGVDVKVLTKSINLLGSLSATYKSRILYVMIDIKAVITDAINVIMEHVDKEGVVK